MRVGWLAEGLLVTLAGAALTTAALLAIPSDRYVHGVIRSMVTTYGRPITPTEIDRRAPFLRAALAVGVCMGLLLVLLGVLTFLKGL